MQSDLRHQFLQFLEHDLRLPPAAVALALQHHHGDYRLLPISLWKYGLVTLDQINDIFDWLESR